ncbi:MAG: globin domain-containing protein [Nitrospira sp.]|nr:globin domain-containing protein [Nitrospira sp.]
MGINVELLEQGFQLVAPRGEELVERFYERLFEKYPSVAPMFKHASMAEQKKKLLASLVLVVENLRRPDTLRNAVMELGVRHAAYGTQPVHYDAVVENLLAVFEEIAGPSWTDDIRAAWKDALSAISSIMIEGTQRRTSGQSSSPGSGRAA